MTLTNSTNSPIELEELIVSGIDFTQTNDCGKAIAANASCTIQVSFKPAIPGDRLGGLEVAARSNAPQFVALNGAGV